MAISLVKAKKVGVYIGSGTMLNKNYTIFGYVIEYFGTCIGNEDCYRTYPELSLGVSF